jgi:hypothetical protein
LHAGLLEPLTAELSDPSDMLACLAALQLVCELAEQATVPREVRAQLLPDVLRLQGGAEQAEAAAAPDPVVRAAAIQAAARLLARAEDARELAPLLQAINSDIQVRTMLLACWAVDLDGMYLPRPSVYVLHVYCRRCDFHKRQ